MQDRTTFLDNEPSYQILVATTIFGKSVNADGTTSMLRRRSLVRVQPDLKGSVAQLVEHLNMSHSFLSLISQSLTNQ